MQMVTKRSTAAHIRTCSHPSPITGSVHDQGGPYVLRYWICQCGHFWTEQSERQMKARTYPLQAQAVAG